MARSWPPSRNVTSDTATAHFDPRTLAASASTMATTPASAARVNDPIPCGEKARQIRTGSIGLFSDKIIETIGTNNVTKIVRIDNDVTPQPASSALGQGPASSSSAAESFATAQSPNPPRIPMTTSNGAAAPKADVARRAWSPVSISSGFDGAVIGLNGEE